MKTLVASVLFLAAVAPVLARPVDDLASPDQAVRDAAAQIQRKEWVHAPRGKWQPVLDKVPAGSPSAAAVDLLKTYHATAEGGDASGGSSKRGIASMTFGSSNS